VPLTPSSRGLIGQAEIAAMAPTARLVNLARGGVIDEDALIEALAEGRIAGAALDVFRDEPLDRASPLWGMPNVIVSPHMSGDLHGYPEALARQFLDNLDRWVSGRPLHNVVDKRLGFVPSDADAPSARRPDAGRPGA
jgi:phosphoglycerate dehydrogenase-like enzyme